ncbi:MAG TPA: hypothetical protein VFB81_20770, partial [Myxococcales bacterium]|nr:hypothetical protein [Myxococcales bacterium]
KEFLETALRNLQPSFQVGPLLATTTGPGANVAVLPAPQVQGYQTEWVEHGKAQGEPVPAMPPEGVLPTKRCSVTEGWLNLVQPEE